MAVKLELAKVHPSIRHRLMGHALGKSVEDTTYLRSLEYSVKELHEALEAVHFPSVSPSTIIK
jgi:hypothetical protein